MLKKIVLVSFVGIASLVSFRLGRGGYDVRVEVPANAAADQCDLVDCAANGCYNHCEGSCLGCCGC